MVVDSKLHQSIKQFIQAITPVSEEGEIAKEKANEVKSCMNRMAMAEGLKITAMPFSGSFAKKTGLKEIAWLGNKSDIDLGIIMEPFDNEGNELACMIPTLEKYLREDFPNEKVDNTKSSATITFVSEELDFDVVPFFQKTDPERQLLLRANEEIRFSSIQKQADFIKRRTKRSKPMSEEVSFNDCMRWMKYWRYVRQSRSSVLHGKSEAAKIPSFLLDLLCAHAFDHCGVRNTYEDTLIAWMQHLLRVTRFRKAIYFDDYIQQHKLSKSGLWKVIDPKDDENNVVKNWSNYQADELHRWLVVSLRHLTRAKKFEKAKAYPEMNNELKSLIGDF